MTVSVEATSLSSLWFRSLQSVITNGDKISGIQEVPNMVMVLKPQFDKPANFDKSPEFDKAFRKIFGDERIDYASSVTFVMPKKDLLGNYVYSQNDPKAKWTNTYWGRMTNWNGEINQIENAIQRMIKDAKNTKMLSVSVYDPKSDHKKVMGGVPCMTALDIKPRNGALHLTAFFRSTRLSKSGYADMNALCELLKYMASRANLKPGSLTLISTSAHIFYSGDEAKQMYAMLDWCKEAISKPKAKKVKK